MGGDSRVGWEEGKGKGIGEEIGVKGCVIETGEGMGVSERGLEWVMEVWDKVGLGGEFGGGWKNEFRVPKSNGMVIMQRGWYGSNTGIFMKWKTIFIKKNMFRHEDTTGAWVKTPIP
ncbi:hypothetical protein ACFX12_035262 [Malus domestica]